MSSQSPSPASENTLTDRIKKLGRRPTSDVVVNRDVVRVLGQVEPLLERAIKAQSLPIREGLQVIESLEKVFSRLRNLPLDIQFIAEARWINRKAHREIERCYKALAHRIAKSLQQGESGAVDALVNGLSSTSFLVRLCCAGLISQSSPRLFTTKHAAEMFEFAKTHSAHPTTRRSQISYFAKWADHKAEGRAAVNVLVKAVEAQPDFFRDSLLVHCFESEEAGHRYLCHVVIRKAAHVLATPEYAASFVRKLSEQREGALCEAGLLESMLKSELNPDDKEATQGILVSFLGSLNSRNENHVSARTLGVLCYQLGDEGERLFLEVLSSISSSLLPRVAIGFENSTSVARVLAQRFANDMSRDPELDEKSVVAYAKALKKLDQQTGTEEALLHLMSFAERREYEGSNLGVPNLIHMWSRENPGRIRAFLHSTVDSALPCGHCAMLGWSRQIANDRYLRDAVVDYTVAALRSHDTKLLSTISDALRLQRSISCFENAPRIIESLSRAGRGESADWISQEILVISALMDVPPSKFAAHLATQSNFFSAPIPDDEGYVEHSSMSYRRSHFAERIYLPILAYLARHHHEDVFLRQTLDRILKIDKDEFRSLLARALIDFPDPANETIIRALIKDSKSAVRIFAFGALAVQGHHGYQEVNRLQSSSDPTVAKEAREAFLNRGFFIMGRRPNYEEHEFSASTSSFA